MAQMYIRSPCTVSIILPDSAQARIPSTDFSTKSLNIKLNANVAGGGPVVPCRHDEAYGHFSRFADEYKNEGTTQHNTTLHPDLS